MISIVLQISLAIDSKHEKHSSRLHNTCYIVDTHVGPIDKLNLTIK